MFKESIKVTDDASVISIESNSQEKVIVSDSTDAININGAASSISIKDNTKDTLIHVEETKHLNIKVKDTHVLDARQSWITNDW